MGIDLAYNLVIFCMYVVALRYNLLYIGDTSGIYNNIFTYRGYGGKTKYLTFWNLCFQTFYFGLCVLNNFFGTNQGPKTDSRSRSGLQKFRDFIHASLIFPAGMFVVCTFWGVYAVDRELVYPKELDKIIPPVMNHIMHTTVLPILLLEKMLVYHQYPRRRSGSIALVGFAMTYLIWILWIAYRVDVWVYPVLKVLNTFQRTVFIGICLVFFLSIYLLGEALTKFLWRKQTIAVSVSKRK